MNYVKEIQTSGWHICVGDVFTNGRMPYHLKVIKIGIDDNEENPDDAKIFCNPVHPKNHNMVLNIIDVPKGDSNRAWYINEFWSK